MKPNPYNSISLYGTIKGPIRFLSTKDGTEYASLFTLAVKRNYRGRNGKYHTDMIPVRYEFNDGDGSFAHALAVEDVIALSGSIYQETEEGKKVIIVRADSIALDEATRNRKYHTHADEIVSADFPVNLPLPY